MEHRTIKNLRPAGRRVCGPLRGYYPQSVGRCLPSVNKKGKQRAPFGLTVTCLLVNSMPSGFYDEVSPNNFLRVVLALNVIPLVISENDSPHSFLLWIEDYILIEERENVRPFMKELRSFVVVIIVQKLCLKLLH